MVAAIADTPFLFKMLDMSSLEAIGVGSGAVSAETVTKMHKLQPKSKVLAGYGQS